jgi:hypothetical protein
VPTPLPTPPLCVGESREGLIPGLRSQRRMIHCALTNAKALGRVRPNQPSEIPVWTLTRAYFAGTDCSWEVASAALSDEALVVLRAPGMVALCRAAGAALFVAAVTLSRTAASFADGVAISRLSGLGDICAIAAVAAADRATAITQTVSFVIFLSIDICH